MTIPSSSHRITNEVLWKLILQRITPESKVLDFGAGRGHMVQRLGNFFGEHGRLPKEHVTACDVAPDAFEYPEIPCLRIGVHSDLPVLDQSQDLIYAIEVLEHVPRPYDFFQTAFAKLKPGGTLLFSVPNILHFVSRLRFLLTGSGELFGPPSTLDQDAGRICGHIMPLSLPYYAYGLQRAGFKDFQFLTDRWKRGSLVLATLFYPWLALASHLADFKLKKYDFRVWEQTRWMVRRINQMDVLSSRSCILIARKPSS
jgi:SAM-dependent methyltransferase